MQTIYRKQSHYGKAFKLQMFNISVIWNPVVEEGCVALLDKQSQKLE